MLLKRVVLSFAVFLWTAIPAAQAEPKQFESVTAMFEELSDYSLENESLLILNEDPLKIRLTKPVYKGDPSGVVKYELQRAVLYGIYRAFIHTDISQISVKAVPMLTSYKPLKETVLDSPVYEITITREQALKALQELLPDAGFESLVVEDEIFSKWSDDFNNLYYEDREPGLDIFYETVVKASK